MPKVETNTNQLFRKKYFINADTIVTGGEEEEEAERLSVTTTPVIDASRVILSREPVPLRRGAAGEASRIHVDVIKDGARVKSIRIACPCGRKAELDVQYGPTG